MMFWLGNKKRNKESLLLLGQFGVYLATDTNNKLFNASKNDVSVQN
jgi:hypothetical protein